MGKYSPIQTHTSVVQPNRLARKEMIFLTNFYFSFRLHLKQAFFLLFGLFLLLFNLFLLLLIGLIPLFGISHGLHCTYLSLTFSHILSINVNYYHLPLDYSTFVPFANFWFGCNFRDALVAFIM